MRTAAAATLPPMTHRFRGDTGSTGTQLRVSAGGAASAPMVGLVLPLTAAASQLPSETAQHNQVAAHVHAGAALQASYSGRGEHRLSISRPSNSISSNSRSHSGRSASCNGAGGSESETEEAIPPTQVQEHALWPGQSPQSSPQLQSARRSEQGCNQRPQEQSAAQLSSAWLQQPAGKENGQHREGSQDCRESAGCSKAPPDSGGRSSSAKRQRKSASCDLSPLKLKV